MDTSGLEEIRAARHELDEVIREIQQVPGYEDFLATPTFEDVAQAAQDQPLVYLAAAEQAGLALVVSGDDVQHVALDRLTADAVQSKVSAHLDAYHRFSADRRGGLAAWRTSLDDTMRWLWDYAMGPVLAEIRPAEAAVLVAGGLLGLLPLHAACTEDATARTGRHYVLDEATITYTPNARALTAARKLAARPASRLLAVVDPSAELRYAPAEAKAAAAGFPGAARILPPEEANSDTIQAALQDADVAHFACHGVANLTEPLDSALLLAPGEQLQLRHLMTLQLQLRLVVLSACATSQPGTDLPDEVVALPTGLLQAGAGGVVSPLWDVPDRPTAMLMFDFYRRWRHEHCDPPLALRRAQQWLRDTSGAEKCELYEDAISVEGTWLPADVADDLIDRMTFQRDDDPLVDAGVEIWAGFTYVGA